MIECAYTYLASNRQWVRSVMSSTERRGMGKGWRRRKDGTKEERKEGGRIGGKKEKKI